MFVSSIRSTSSRWRFRREARDAANGHGNSSRPAKSIASGSATCLPDTRSMRQFQTMSDLNRSDLEARFRAKRDWHRWQAGLSLKEKFRILLQLQRQDLPLIKRQRPLRSWERPWDIEP